jgi:hypothetical protein
VHRFSPARRRLLTVCAGLPLLSSLGCGTTGHETPAPRPTTEPTGDAALVDRVLADEKRILSRIDGTLKARPGTRVRLGPVRVIVATHVDWLSDLRVSATDETPSAPTTTVPTGTPSSELRPADRRTAIRAVAALCSEAADERLRNCIAATAGPLAQLLGSMSASYVVLVEELRGS